jgi:acetyl-CoA acyltransferase 1
MALNHVGYPISTTLYTVNRACASGLQAVTNIADSITVGRIDAGIAGGMESMTRNYGSRAIPTILWQELRDSPVKDALDCIMSMGLTSENVSERYDVNRKNQDEFAAESHIKAAKAQAAGNFDSEIVPVTVKTVSEDGTTSTNTISQDDGIRPNSTAESLAKLKPVFKPEGSSTAGNSSQVSDGAAAALMMRRSKAEELGLSDQIVGKWVGTEIVGVAPDEMGIGPAVAVPRLLSNLGIETEEVDVWELNEAFASQALYCIRKLGLDIAKVNPNGGAIALGHPLGATGARQLATLLPELHRQGKSVGVITMCIGTGQGMASLIVAE